MNYWRAGNGELQKMRLLASPRVFKSTIDTPNPHTTVHHKKKSIPIILYRFRQQAVTSGNVYKSSKHRQTANVFVNCSKTVTNYIGFHLDVQRHEHTKITTFVYI
jgi:hypothetical protein